MLDVVKTLKRKNPLKKKKKKKESLENLFRKCELLYDQLIKLLRPLGNKGMIRLV